MASGAISISLRRAMRDVDTVCSRSAESLAAQGIYYIADDENVMRGLALLVGRPGTPYYGGFYFFRVEFPDDYPYSPLRLTSLTQDGITRFNPNLYINGKVCLSILNTWHDGPQWSGIQTLESVLLVVMSDVLNASPIQNEPAYHNVKPDDHQAVLYNRSIFHSNVGVAMLRMLSDPPAFALPFKDIMETEFLKVADTVLRLVEDHAARYDGTSDRVSVFSMNVTYNFAALARKLNTVKNCVKKTHPE